MHFVRVKEEPATLAKGEFVIKSPTFIDEIKACTGKRPRNEIMSINYLRELVANIGSKYLPETFNALTDVNVTNFKGTPCSSEEQANETLLKLFKQSYPAALDAYVEYHIKSRPNGTHTIYFLGAGSYADVFLRNGIQEVLYKDLEKDSKSKKVVGKPAVTKETAEKSKTVV